MSYCPLLCLYLLIFIIFPLIVLYQDISHMVKAMDKIHKPNLDINQQAILQQPPLDTKEPMVHQTKPTSPLGHMEVVTSHLNLVAVQGTSKVEVDTRLVVVVVVVVVVAVVVAVVVVVVAAVVGINSKATTKVKVVLPNQITSHKVVMVVAIPLGEQVVVVAMVVALVVAEEEDMNQDILAVVVEAVVVVVLTAVVAVEDTEGMYCFILSIIHHKYIYNNS